MKLFYCLCHITCVLLLLTNVANSAYLRLYCGAIEKFRFVPLSAPTSLLKSECFDTSQNSVFYAFGFRSNPDTNASVLMIQTYLSMKKYNIFIFDWREEVSSLFDLDPIRYKQVAVPNAKKVGKICGRSFHVMSKNGLDLGTTHVIGLSLGAQMVGYCGRELQKFNKTIPRITGLDPAGPIFDDIGTGLLPSSADFVDIIHTDPWFLGTKKQLGHVDIWFNCHARAQPNCADPSVLKVIDVSSCNHEDAVRYYAAALLYASGFPAVAGRSCQEWQASDGTEDTLIYVGDNTDRRARGNFFLRTDAKYPFGKGTSGSYYHEVR